MCDLPIEQAVNVAIHSSGTKFERAKLAVQKLLKEVVADHSLLVISPHNSRATPIDADAMTFAAALLAHVNFLNGSHHAREIKFLSGADDKLDPRALNILFYPTTAVDGDSWQSDDREILLAIKATGKKALIVGDMECRFHGARERQI